MSCAVLFYLRRLLPLLLIGPEAPYPRLPQAQSEASSMLAVKRPIAG